MHTLLRVQSKLKLDVKDRYLTAVCLVCVSNRITVKESIIRKAVDSLVLRCQTTMLYDNSFC